MPIIDVEEFKKQREAEGHEWRERTTKEVLFELSEFGNVLRLEHYYRNRLRYCREIKTWYLESGGIWKEANVYGLLEEIINMMPPRECSPTDDDAANAVRKFAAKCNTHQHKTAVINAAQSGTRFEIERGELNKDPLLAAAKSGTIFSTIGGGLTEGKFITKRLGAQYKENADCPCWLAFLNQIMLGREDLVNFIQRAMGYSLSGDTSEQCMFFLYGIGRNGKSTFLRIFEKLMGDYATRISTNTLMHKGGDMATRDLARLVDVRVAIANETGGEDRISEPVVKDLTGQDTMVARKLYCDSFVFEPVAKLWMYGNHKPRITGTDEGIWRRIRLIPFELNLAEGEQDQGLEDKLLAELPGILNWVIEGGRKWKEDGLPIPELVRDATQEYRREQDSVGNFLAECCTERSNVMTRSAQVYAAYKNWCEENGERARAMRWFKLNMVERGWKWQKRESANYWLNLAVNSEPGEYYAG